MNMEFNWFHHGPVPLDAIHGSYNLSLVALSYVIAVLASYVALDLAGRLRAEKNKKSKFYWLCGGAFAMGAGIWSMHFIGMLAFIMPAPMDYEFAWTISSMVVAMLAAAFALFLLQSESRKFSSLILGGVLLGFGIATMHYMGMEAMASHVNIRYLPGLFWLSILIAILASEAALWLITQSNKGSYKKQLLLKGSSALVMGAAICGMHYTGMTAAVFTPHAHQIMVGRNIDPAMLAFYIAVITGVIITIALMLSTYKQLMVSAVQNEKNFLNAMLDNLEDGIIACDAKGKITLVNQTLQQKLNLSTNPKSFNDLAKYFHFRSTDIQADIYKDNNPLFQALHGDRIRGVQLFMGLKEGTTRTVMLDSQPILDTQKKRLGAVVVIHDITERIQVEKLKNEFVSTVSHELRTPLTSIRGSLGLIIGGATGALNEKTKNMLDIAHNNCERLIRLINDILDIEKIEAGKMDFNLQPTSLLELMTDSIAANQAYGEKFGVKIQLMSQIPDIKINVDRDRLTQVMTNLISNAVKFSPTGETVALSVTVINKWVKIAVTDLGKGISKEFQKRIFQKFAQADSSDDRRQGGTGLGLSISKTIVERLGGKLSFSSEENKGTTFFFQLPIWHEKLTSSITEAPKKIPKILVCEDDKDIASLLNIILSENGFEVDTAYSIRQSKELLNTKQYDAMTVDLILPDGDGISLIQELRKDVKYENLPIIVISGKVDATPNLLNGDAINILDWLKKPVDAQQMANAIKHIKIKLKKKPNILHVEDDVDLLKIIAIMVEKEATLKTAGTIQEAQALLGQENFDLVLLDLILPDGSGTELLPLLGKLHIPVIVFSANELPKDYVHYVTAALTKSRNTDSDLLAAITAAINKLGENNENA